MPQEAPHILPSTARRKVARHQIRVDLQQRILNGEWRPGSKLIQQQLAKEFGVSMGLVREALLELQAWGLVETHDNRGIFVRRWNVDRLLEAYDVGKGLCRSFAMRDILEWDVRPVGPAPGTREER